METEIIVALLSFLGTLAGTFAGIYATSKLTVYRLQQLEKKVDLHNNAVERLFIAEGQIKELQHEIQDIKHTHH